MEGCVQVIPVRVGVDPEAAPDLLDRVRLDGELRHDAELAPASPEGDGQVRAGGGVDVGDRSVGQDDLPPDNAVGCQAVLCAQEGDASLEQVSADADYAQAATDHGHIVRCKVTDHIVPGSAGLDRGEVRTSIIGDTGNVPHGNQNTVLDTSMTRVRVVPTALGREVDIGVFVENLHDRSDLVCALRVDDTGWLYVAQGSGPVLLRLGDVVQLKGP